MKDLRINSSYLTTALLVLLSSTCLAANAPYYGAEFSYPAIAKDPASLHGAQIMLSYDPQSIQWRQFNVYFDGGFSHFWITNRPYYTTLNIYSIAPVVRYTFKKRGPISPYLEFSIGAAYLNHTHLDNRNLGIHYAFQDRLGVGFYLGTTRQVSLGIHALHYSNAHLSAHNSGISIPLEIDIAYRFC
jgi:hypothetical protein